MEGGMLTPPEIETVQKGGTGIQLNRSIQKGNIVRENHLSLMGQDGEQRRESCPIMELFKDSEPAKNVSSKEEQSSMKKEAKGKNLAEKEEE